MDMKKYDETLVEGLNWLPGSGVAKEMRWQHYSSAAWGGVLVGVFDNGLRKTVVPLRSQSEFEAYEFRYSAGFFLSRDYYSVPSSRFNQVE